MAAPAGVWRLPGGAPDAWLLESDASLEAGGDGYVVAHLSRNGANEMWGGRVPITYNNADGDSRDFWVSTLLSAPAARLASISSQ